ncbi:DUF2089 family protein [Nitratifractor sp.]
MIHCPICDHDLTMTACECEACRTTYNARFKLPRLARLSEEERKLTEALILHGGNLKEMAQAVNISYPTLKKRLGELADALAAKKAEDEAAIEQILQQMEHKEISPQEGIKRIREVNGEL